MQGIISSITESGRRRIRDVKRYRIERELRRHEWFANAPRLVISGLADLIVVSRELRTLMLTEGLMREDKQDVHPAVKAFREYKGTELNYLKQMVEMRGVQSSQSDLVAAMSEVTDVVEEVASSEPEPEGQGKPTETEPATAERSESAEPPESDGKP